MSSWYFCGYPDIGKSDWFCSNCGKPVKSNHCTNPECEYSTWDPDESDGALDESACYCLLCGSESAHFKEGLIKPRQYKQEE
jgi:hypothetical protein